MKNSIPKPQMDEDSRPFWEGARNHKLMIQQCETCRQYIFYPRIICPYCYSDLVSWVEASGHGKIHSYTVVHNAMPPFKGQTPYTIAIIELVEGTRMLSRIVGDRNDIGIDKPVSVVFEKIDDELTLPYFKVQ